MFSRFVSTSFLLLLLLPFPRYAHRFAEISPQPQPRPAESGSRSDHNITDWLTPHHISPRYYPTLCSNHRRGHPQGQRDDRGEPGAARDHHHGLGAVRAGRRDQGVLGGRGDGHPAVLAPFPLFLHRGENYTATKVPPFRAPIPFVHPNGRSAPIFFRPVAYLDAVQIWLSSAGVSSASAVDCVCMGATVALTHPAVRGCMARLGRA